MGLCRSGTASGRRGALLAVTLVLALAALAMPVDANGTPIRIGLSYLPGVSNWGPSDATGIAEILVGEGEVRVHASGLQPLANEYYRVWVVNWATSDRLALGSLRPDATGAGRLDLVLPSTIPERGWDLMLVSVEAEGSQPTEPGPRRSIAGRFSPPIGGDVRAAQGDSPADRPVGIGPSISPETNTWVNTIGAWLLGLVFSTLLAFGIGRAGAGRMARRGGKATPRAQGRPCEGGDEAS